MQRLYFFVVIWIVTDYSENQLSETYSINPKRLTIK